MASDKKYVDYVLGQINVSYPIRTRQKMGGTLSTAMRKLLRSYATTRSMSNLQIAAKKFMEIFEEELPYPGAKPHFLVDDRLEDETWISRLIETTTKSPPAPKKRKA